VVAGRLATQRADKLSFREDEMALIDDTAADAVPRSAADNNQQGVWRWPKF
jgi:hypothetical protein